MRHFGKKRIIQAVREQLDQPVAAVEHKPRPFRPRKKPPASDFQSRILSPELIAQARREVKLRDRLWAQIYLRHSG